MSLIDCKIQLGLSCSKDCIISGISRTSEVPANPAANLLNNRVPPNETTGATFKINKTKLVVPIFTLYFVCKQ